MPSHIRRHSEQVQRVSEVLSAALRAAAATELDPDALRAAALLHDIAKMECIDNHRDHAAEGCRLLSELGMPVVAELVGRHVRLGSWNPHGPVTGAEVLNYSDKRVQHEAIVSLEERYEDLLVRYGRGRPEVERRIRRDWEIIAAVEEKIFAELPFGPGQVENLVIRDW